MKQLAWAVGLVAVWASVAVAAPSVRGVSATKCQTQGACSGMDVPVETQVGDLLLNFCQTDGAAVTTPTDQGWSLVKSSLKSTSPVVSLYVFSKIATNNDVPAANQDTATAHDGNNTCEACYVAEPTGATTELLCRIIAVSGSTGSADSSESNPQSGTPSIVICGTGTGSCTGLTATNASVADTLVFAAAAGPTSESSVSENKASDGVIVLASGGAGFSNVTNASLASLTERIDNTTTVGDDGSLFVATGTFSSTGSWGNTTVTSDANMTWANVTFNLILAPTPTPTLTPTPVPADTNTPTSTATFDTPTRTRTPTPADTATNTATRTSTATGTVTQTPSRTNTHTPTATITLTPTATTIPNKCQQQSNGGSHTLKGTCTGPEDDFIVLLNKPTPGSTEFAGFGISRPYDEYRDPNDIKIGSSPSPHILKGGFTLISSLDDIRTVLFDIAPTYVPSMTSADLASMGACVNDQPCAWGNLPTWNGDEVAPFSHLRVNCGPFLLDNITHYCRLVDGTAIDSRYETVEPDGCFPRLSSITVFNGSTETAMPANCALSVGLSVNGADGSGICAVSALASRSVSTACDDAVSGWSSYDSVGLTVTGVGAGCTGGISRSAVVSVSCSGE